MSRSQPLFLILLSIFACLLCRSPSFFLACVLLQLVSLLRDEYRRRGYEEVRSPLMYRRELWETSGHLAAYAENMYTVRPGLAPLPAPAATAAAPAASAVAAPAAVSDASAGSHEHKHSNSSCCSHTHEGEEEEPEEVFGLKPMNCPGHCLIFKHVSRSLRPVVSDHTWAPCEPY